MRPPGGPGRPRRASQEAELLTLFAGSVLRGADLTALLEKVARDLRSACGELAATTTDGVVASVGDDPPERADNADTACEVRDGDYGCSGRTDAATPGTGGC